MNIDGGNILVVGARGNMGRRYLACLRALGLKPVAIDQPWPDIVPQWTRAIIASETSAHWAAVLDLIQHTPEDGQYRHVLMEKPVAKSVVFARAIYDALTRHRMRLFCVNQYQYLPGVIEDQERGVMGRTSYDYYNHGRDGLHWDCFQLYALARGEVQLREGSPVWRCEINGREMSSCDMDPAYLSMLEDWLGPQRYSWKWPTIHWTTARVAVAEVKHQAAQHP